MKEVQFKTLAGYTLENIFSRKEVIFTTTNGNVFVLLNTITNYRQEGDDASVLNSPVTTAKYSFNKKKYKFQTEDEHSFTIDTTTGKCTFSWLGGNPKLYEVTEDDNDELCVKAKTLSDSPTIFANFKSEEEVYFRVVGKAGLEFYTKTSTLYGSVEELATTLLGSAKPLDVVYKDTKHEELKMKELTFSSLKLVEFSTLLGKTLTAIDVDDTRITFTTNTGNKYVQYHEQDCCETVWLETHDGDISDLIGSEILQAEEVIDSKYNSEALESVTYSFYKLSTNKGSCTFTWRGESNGYYSESVDFAEIVKEKDAA